MRKIIIIHLLLAWLLLMPSSAYAALDPTRLAAIELASSQAKKTLEAQVKSQGLMTTGHIWTKEEIEATTEFQREFNTYLDMFHDAISIAAEVYGIYYEVKQTSKNGYPKGHHGRVQDDRTGEVEGYRCDTPETP